MKAEDAIRVIIAGYNDPTHRGAMTEFFLKQLKKAQAEQQEPEEFFWYCHNALRTLEGDLRRQLDIDSRTLARDLRAATAKGDINTIEAIEADIRGLRVDTYSVNLSAVTEGKCDGYMTYQEVKDISDCCKKAELQFCNRPEEMVRHYRKLKEKGAPRTPLTVPFHTVELKKEHFERFCTFLDHLSEEERRDEILIAIKDIGKRIKHLSEGGNQSRRERDYEKMIESLQKKLEGTTGKSWAGLYNDLRRYVADVSEHDFSYVVNNHKLPEGRVNKIKWTGDVSRLAYFGQEYFNSSWKQLNNCFDAGNSRGVKAGNVPESVRKNNPVGKPDKKLRDFREILEKHKNQ